MGSGYCATCGHGYGQHVHSSRDPFYIGPEGGAVIPKADPEAWLGCCVDTCPCVAWVQGQTAVEAAMAESPTCQGASGRADGRCFRRTRHYTRLCAQHRWQAATRAERHS